MTYLSFYTVIPRPMGSHVTTLVLHMWVLKRKDFNFSGNIMISNWYNKLELTLT